MGRSREDICGLLAMANSHGRVLAIFVGRRRVICRRGTAPGPGAGKSHSPGPERHGFLDRGVTLPRSGRSRTPRTSRSHVRGHGRVTLRQPGPSHIRPQRSHDVDRRVATRPGASPRHGTDHAQADAQRPALGLAASDIRGRCARPPILNPAWLVSSESVRVLPGPPAPSEG